MSATQHHTGDDVEAREEGGGRGGGGDRGGVYTAAENEVDIAKEFQLSNFRLSHPQPGLLASGQWGRPIFYLVWRVVWAVYHAVVFILVLATQCEGTSCLLFPHTWAKLCQVLRKEPSTFWLIFPSGWGFLLLTMLTITQAVTRVYLTVKRKEFPGIGGGEEEEEEGAEREREGEGEGQGGERQRRTTYTITTTPWYLKVTWVLYTLACDSALTLTIVYYMFVFDEIGEFSVISVFLNLLTSLYVIADLCVTAMPVRLAHGAFFVAMLVAYLLVYVLVLQGTEGKYEGQPCVYLALEWAFTGGVGPGITIVMLVVHVILWGMYALRVYFWNDLRRAELEREAGGL